MLSLFGRPTLTAPSGRRISLHPTGWRLLAALAAEPDSSVTRAELARLVISTSKLSTLRKVIWDLRKALDGAGIDLLEVQGDALRLSRAVLCDVRDLQAPRPTRAPHEIYRGIFFETEASFEHPPWTAWLAARREQLRDLYVSRASDLLRGEDVDRATKAREARHLLRHAPAHEEATRVLMLEGARERDAAEVRRRFSDLRSNLDASEPDRRTTDFLHRLVGESQRRLGDDAAGMAGLPTVRIALPPGMSRSRTARLLRSLLVDIRIGLCRASSFRVIAWDGGLPEVQPPPAPGDAGGRLYALDSAIVDHVLGPQIVFTLVSIPTRDVLWTERVSSAAEMTVEAYNLLMGGILRSLVRRIQDVEVRAFQTEAEPSAYASYLLGHSSLASLDLARLRKGRAHLRRSLSHMPNFAPTASALARSFQLEWLILGRGDSELLGLSRQHSLQAITSDPLESRAFKALGFCDLFSKNFEAAQENYAKAEQLSRNNFEIVVGHANCLVHCGLLEEAIGRLDYAKMLDIDVDDAYLWTRASAYYLMGRYDDASIAIESMRDRIPAMRLLAATHAMRGNRAEAEECRMKVLQSYPTMTIDGWISTAAMRDPRQILHYAEGLARAGFRRSA